MPLNEEQFETIMGELARVAGQERGVLALLDGLYAVTFQLAREVREMATTTATRADLDAAIAAQAAAVTQAFTDLEAKIAAGTVATPEDFSSEVASLKAGLAAALAADPGTAAVQAPVLTPVPAAPVTTLTGAPTVADAPIVTGTPAAANALKPVQVIENPPTDGPILTPGQPQSGPIQAPQIPESNPSL